MKWPAGLFAYWRGASACMTGFEFANGDDNLGAIATLSFDFFEGAC